MVNREGINGKYLIDLLEQICSIQNVIEPMQKLYIEQNAPNFSPLRPLRAERTISKILAALLDPNESHGQGRLFLDEFLASVDIAKEEILGPINIITEAPVSQPSKGFVDILIQSQGPPIIIEVKIDARDGKDQMERYFDAICHRFEIAPYMVYLTKDGYDPSPFSLGRLEKTSCRSLSLAPDGQSKCSLTAVLECAARKCRAERVRVFVELLASHFVEMGKSHSSPLEPRIMSIIEYLQSSSNRLDAALGIRDAIEPVKCALVAKFASCIRTSLESNAEIDLVCVDKSLENIAKMPIDKDKFYPSVSFRALNGKRDLCVRLECAEAGAWYGVHFASEKISSRKKKAYRSALLRELGTDEDDGDPNWAWWTYLEHFPSDRNLFPIHRTVRT